MELNTLVAEYMNEKGLASTVEVFKEECKRKKMLLNVSSAHNDSQLAGAKFEELMVAFECGEHEAFFTSWSDLVPSHLLQNDPTCQDLEFSLSVYFALYPIIHKTGDHHASMMKFREYLDKNGTQLSKLQSFTVYCALPYIPDPAAHPSFKHLFTDYWKRELQSRLQEFLKVFSLQSNTALTLEDLYYNTIEIGVIRQRLQQVQSDYHALAEIAIELVEALEATIAGKILNPGYIQQMCTKLIKASNERPPSQSAQNPFPLNELKRPKSALQESVESLRQSITTCDPLGRSSRYPDLDISRLKHDLLMLPNESKIMLLKALRWRLTRSRPGLGRDSAINGYIALDIFGVKDTVRPSESVLNLINCKDESVKEHLCRLLNSLSSLKVGRDYLQICKSLNHTLCEQLTSLHEETPILRNVLGTVQKLSLRYNFGL